MDQGHYNCRDYYITPHIAPTTLTNDRNLVPRHESFDELEQRSRSPASQQPKFPLFRLPLELRQQILRYLLPYTQEFRNSSGLGDHVRNFSAVRKREAKGMFVPRRKMATPTQMGFNNVCWQRGFVNVMRVNKQLHDECAELVYGSNTFLLFVTYLEINFRFRWLLPSGLAPMRNVDFLKLMPPHYLRLIKKVVVHVDHVDPYMGMIKFNVQGKGLAAGMRKQLERLCGALQSVPGEDSRDGDFVPERRLVKVHVLVSNGNSSVEALKPSTIDEVIQSNNDIEEVLEPLSSLRGIHDVSICGAVLGDFAVLLTERMKERLSAEELQALNAERSTRVDDMAIEPPLCVYGNDML